MNRELIKRGKIKLLGLVAAMLLICPKVEAEAAEETIIISCNQLENGDYYKNDVITHTYNAATKEITLNEGYSFNLYDCTGQVEIINNRGILKYTDGTVNSINNYGVISMGD